MNGDILGRVTTSDESGWLQFTVTHNPDQPGRTYNWLPFIGWFRLEPIKGDSFKRPTGCRCKTYLRGDTNTVSAWVKASGIKTDGGGLCACYGRFVE